MLELLLQIVRALIVGVAAAAFVVLRGLLREAVKLRRVLMQHGYVFVLILVLWVGVVCAFVIHKLIWIVDR